MFLYNQGISVAHTHTQSNLVGVEVFEDDDMVRLSHCGPCSVLPGR